MAQKIITSFVCDNCENEIEDAAVATTITLKLSGDRTTHGRQVDLCVPCGARIRALMDKGREVRAGRPPRGTTAPPTGRKRGRPSKADLAAREAAAALEAEGAGPEVGTPTLAVAPPDETQESADFGADAVPTPDFGTDTSVVAAAPGATPFSHAQTNA